MIDQDPVVGSQVKPGFVNNNSAIDLGVAPFVKAEMRLGVVAVVTEQSFIGPDPDKSLMILQKATDGRCSGSQADVVEHPIICLLPVNPGKTQEMEQKEGTGSLIHIQVLKRLYDKVMLSLLKYKEDSHMLFRIKKR
jgi:hypothetical protein